MFADPQDIRPLVGLDDAAIEPFGQDIICECGCSQRRRIERYGAFSRGDAFDLLDLQSRYF